MGRSDGRWAEMEARGRKGGGQLVSSSKVLAQRSDTSKAGSALTEKDRADRGIDLKPESQ